MDATRIIGTNLFGILCDKQGKIKTVLYNKMPHKIPLETGQALASGLGGMQTGIILDFLERLKREHLVANWEIKLNAWDQGRTIYLFGFRFDEDVMVVGRNGLSEDQYFLTELVKINNEQMNALRDANQSLRKEIGDGRKKAKELMLYNHAMETAPDGIMITDAQQGNQIIYCNSAFEQITGYDRAEALGQNCRFLQREDREQADLVVLREAILKGQSADVLLRNYRKDGSLFWNDLTISPIKDADGQVTHFVGVQRDVTKRVEAEHKVLELNQRIKLATESGDIGIWEMNLETREFIWDDKTYRLFGVDPKAQESGLEIFRKVVHPDDHDMIHDRVKALVENGDEIHVQFRIVLPDGSIRNLEAHAIVVSDVYQQPQKIIGMTTDVTERLKAEEDLRRIQNLESLGVLAGGIAHDFNNMLTGIMGNLSLLEHTLEEGSEVQKLAKDGLEASMQTRSLTQQLLTFAKGGEPVKGVIDVEKMIRATTELTLRGAQTKPEFHFVENLHAIEGDGGQLSQVVQNLVINADQAMPQGGTLKIEADNVVVSESNEFFLPPGDFVKIVVTDQGIGMPEDLLSKIFDPYYSTKDSGHGLGLSITYSIIQRHGGYIGVQSQEGVGSTFEIYLPAFLQTKLADKTKDSIDVMKGTGRILLVDDQDIIHRTVSRILAGLGYEVGNAYSGADAVLQYREALENNQRYDVVIVDMTMPGGIGGQETMTQLLEIDPLARGIVSSGYAQDSLMNEFEQHGFVGCLPKPIDFYDLAQAVQNAMKIKND